MDVCLIMLLINRCKSCKVGRIYVQTFLFWKFKNTSVETFGSVTPQLFTYSSVYEPELERVDGALSMYPILALD